MRYPKMAEVLNPAEGDRFKVDVFEITNENFRAIFHDGISPGKYARLVDKELHECVMSDTRMEQVTNGDFVLNAHGKVLIGGLGIGMVLLAIQDKPDVEEIVVVEKYQEVIDLVRNQLPLNNKVRVVCEDIFEYEPEQKFNTIYLDIWNNANDRLIYEREQKPLRMRYRKYLVSKEDDPDRWIDCWMYKHNRDEDFHWGMY